MNYRILLMLLVIAEPTVGATNHPIEKIACNMKNEKGETISQTYTINYGKKSITRKIDNQKYKIILNRPNAVRGYQENILSSGAKERTYFLFNKETRISTLTGYRELSDKEVRDCESKPGPEYIDALGGGKVKRCDRAYNAVRLKHSFRGSCKLIGK